MKLGVLLPTFRDDASAAFEVAERAQQLGIDGVFAFDHLWPMGSPKRPALAPFPVLAAVASRYPTLHVGPLVARVGLVSTSKLVEQFTTLEALAPGRVVAAIGTGDRLSADEQVAYGLGYRSASERRELLGAALEALRGRMSVWCGAGSTLTNQLARDLGVEINLWGVDLAGVRDVAQRGPVNWAGPLGDDVGAMLSGLADLGATWAIAASSKDLDRLKEWREAH